MFENKKKFPLWAYPDTLEKVEELYREDNCRSQSEFIEKAVNFYIGYLTSIDPLSLERLRGECVKEVKRLNGGFSFEDALTWQKG